MMARLWPLLKGLALIATLALVGYALEMAGLDDAIGRDWVDNDVRGRGLYGELVFVGVGALAMAVGLPRQLFAFLGGYAFGLAEGLAFSLLAAGLGCVLAFAYARVLGRGVVMRHFGPRIRRLDSFLYDNPFSFALLLRLLPVGSNLLISLAAGVTRVRAVPFVAGSVVGYVPQTLVFVLLGTGMKIQPAWRITGSVALFLVSGLLGLYLFRRFRATRRLDEGLEEALAGPAASARQP